MAEAKAAELATGITVTPRISPSLLAAVVEAAYLLDAAGRR